MYRTTFCRFYTVQDKIDQKLPLVPRTPNYKKQESRLKRLFQPASAAFERPTRLELRYLHLGKVALYQMSYGR